MRNVLIYFLVITLASSPLFAQTNPDSALVKQRNDMLFRYLDSKNTGDMQQKTVLEQVLQQADELLKKDNELLDTLALRSAAFDSISLKMDIHQSEMDSLKKENESFGNYFLYGIYGAAGCGLLILVLILLVIIFSSAKAKLKKKIKSTDALEKDNENLKLEISSVEKVMKQNADMIEKLNRTVEMKDNRIKDMQAAVDGADTKFNDKCAEYDKIILDLRSNETNLISDKIKANTKASETVNQLEARIHELEAELGNPAPVTQTDNSELEALKASFEDQKRDLERQLQETSAARENQVHELEKTVDELRKNQNTIIEEREQSEHALMQRLSEAEARATEYESILNDPEKRSFRDQEFNKKLSEMELRVIKLGKIDRMMKDGLITFEEYSVIKQKLLEDF